MLAVVTALLCGVAGVVVRSAAAQDATPDTGGQLAGISPELAQVPVTGPQVSVAAAAVRDVEDGIDGAAQAQREAEGRAADLVTERVGLEAATVAHQHARGDAEARHLQAEQDVVWFEGQLVAVQHVIDELAVSNYVGAEDDGFEFETAAVPLARQRTTYSRAVFQRQQEEHARLVAGRDEATARSAQATADGEAARVALVEDDRLLTANSEGTATAATAAAAAVADQVRLSAELTDVQAALAEARRTGEIPGSTGMRLVVLDAIWKATVVEAERRPECALDWTLLAAISRVEGRHGTYGGSQVDTDGNVHPAIIGPALDGVEFARIPDSDGGRYDGDTTWDRAVGPMQFIPSSWTIFGEDADGNGFNDPNNMYDATLAAAEHLCRNGADTSTPAGRQQALFSYNQSDSYRITVEGYQRGYQALLPDL